MKLHYLPAPDSLYIDLSDAPSRESKEVAEGVVIGFDAQGQVVGIDIDRASRKLKLDTLELKALPLREVKMD